MAGKGNGVGTYDGSAGQYNIFQGLQYTPFELIWPSIPFDDPGAGTRTLRFVNVRVRVTSESPVVTFTVSATGLTINNPTVVVANVVSSLATSAQNGVAGPNGVTSFDMVFTEQLAGAWKTRTVAPFVNNDTSPTPIDQNTPGTVYATESGFHDAGAHALVNRSSMTVAGLAHSGTRLTVRLDLAPPYISVSAPLVVNLMSGNTVTGVARRIDQVSMDGQGDFVPRSSTQFDYDNDFFQMYAHYEILSTSSAQIESVRIPITINYLPMAPTMTTITGLAGLSPDENPMTLSPSFHRMSPLMAEGSPTPEIQTTQLPSTIAGAEYSVGLQALGGTPPYTWFSQNLPSGLTLSPTGFLSGSLSNEGSFQFSVMVTDAAMGQDSQTLAIVVNPALSLVTPPQLPGTKAQKPYSTSFEAAGGVSPYTFSMSGTGVPGMTLAADGTFGGLPTEQGTFTFLVTVKDATNASVSGTYSIMIEPLPQVVAPSVMTMKFTGSVGGDKPAAQSLALVAGNQQQASFALTVEDGPRAASPTWLSYSLDDGAIPARLTISVNQAGLAPGTYKAKITIVQPSNLSQAPIVIEVTLVVAAQSPDLEVSPDAVEFTAVRGTPDKQRRNLSLRNNGGGGAISFTASFKNSSSWVKLLSPASGQTQSNNVTPLEIEVDSTSLAAGQYRDVLRIVSASETVEVPVALLVYEGGAAMDLSQDGVSFTTRAGSGIATPRQVRVINRGDSSSTLHWTAQKLDQADTWFHVVQPSGLSTPLQPGTLTIALTSNAATLPAGSYYGLVQVSDPAALDAPDYLLVVLEVKAANAPITLDLETAGVVFVAPPFDPSSRSTKIRFSATSSTNVAFQAAAASENDGDWLRVTPFTGLVSAGTFTEITIHATSGGLAEGIYRGEVIVARGESVRAINVTFIVAEPVALASDTSRIRAAACAPSKLALTSTGMPNHFQVPAGWPATITAELRNNCGAMVNGASVIASFNNGDAPISLQPDGVPGVYSATWEPGTALANVNVTLRASAPGLESSSPLLIGSVTPNRVPKLVPNGTLHGVFAEVLAPLAPGSIAQIYGTDLATVTEATNQAPLPATYKGTHVLIAGQDAPLYYVSPEVVVVQLPSNLTPNQSASVVIEVGDAITVPDQVQIVPVKPGVSQFLDGKLIVQHADYSLVTDEKPAKPGEILTMYLVGLGATNPPVIAGALSPVTPLALPVVVPTVTVDGQPAQVAFAGMTPLAVGLFQINFFVPANARTGVPLDVVVKQGNVPATTTTLTLVPR
jgi:uncharacterized protein (TIGR03437 family)